MTPNFKTTVTPTDPAERAPDGSEVRPLVATDRASMSHFTFHPGTVSPAVRHRRVEEVWYVVDGRARMWRFDGSAAAIVDLHPGVALSIPAGTSFQVSVDIDRPLVVVGVTMPPWPSEGDADLVEGTWPPGRTT
jgi:mannose-6-phosphate isomerase-like protein (cupin superfamily)